MMQLFYHCLANFHELPIFEKGGIMFVRQFVQSLTHQT
jgi:hypothetical protein